MPDIVISPDSTSPLNELAVQNAIRHGYPSLFARKMFNSDGAALRERWVGQKEEFMSSYQIDEQMWQAYLAHAVESGMIVGTSTEGADQTFSQAAIDDSRKTLEVVLKARIAQRLYRSEAWYPVFNTIDPMINSALKLWNHAVSLAERRTLDTSTLED